MKPNSNREEALFQAAVQLTGSARAMFLDGACQGAPALRQQLEALLAANDAEDPFLEPANPKTKHGLAGTVLIEFNDVLDETVGQKIGRYKILENIGEGGCGVVYVAEQTEPVRRRVALKVIKLGMDTKQVVARFEAERQALALMDHPNIAKVLDAGTTENGRPYFIMELVRGIRITDYCDQNNLSTKERLDLFIQVCHAIQHAHQKGIIHRDIKPSNILVTLHDGIPVPKVIDFGIAKATEGRLTDATVYTQLNQFIGTPAYMSPEQAEMSGLDIDTRSDIYSLGVLLYELLTGKTPLDTQELISQGIDVLRRTIREQEPPRPSLRLATLQGEELTTTAKRRSVEAPKLIHLLKGDLDWIVMKCLEKDRTRRYETANGLAMDIQRHLNTEPVIARPPSKLYEFQRTVRRHKFGFAATAAIIIVLAFGVTLTTWQAARAKREAARATKVLDELRQAAPAFAVQARSLAAMEHFDEAVKKLDYAIKLRPDVPEYLVTKGDLLECQFKFAEAEAAYREALRLKPGFARAKSSAMLCDELLAAKPAADGKLSRECLAKLYVAMQDQQRPAAELMPVAQLLGKAKEQLVQYWLERLKDLPVPDLKHRLTVREDGLLALDLNNTKITELAPLAGMPLGSLDLDGCNQVSDFSPMREFRSLTSLQLRRTQIMNLNPLQDLPLVELALDQAPVFDISALRGMRLKTLSLRDTRVADLSPLAGMPLDHLDVSNISAADYSPLTGAPLEVCFIQHSPLEDLSFLKESPLKELALDGSNGARGYAVLDGLKSLSVLILPDNYRNLPEEDLTAIDKLRNSPALKNIDTSERRTALWIIGTAQTADEFWKSWDRERTLTAPLRKAGFKYTLNPLPDGKYRLTIENQPLSDLSFLKNAPVEELDLFGTRVSDLRPLENLALTHLDIRMTQVTDLSPLRAPVLSSSLRELDLWRIPAMDFLPLAACTNLDHFDAADTALTNLDVVRGRKLHVALLSGTKITDISVLAGMPLERVTLGNTAVTDISPLLQCPTVTELVLPPGARDVKMFHSLPGLDGLSYDELSGGHTKQTAGEFWLSEEPGGITAKTVLALSKESIQTPLDSILAMKVAALQAWFGLDDEYMATCKRVIEAAEQAPKTEDVTERAAKDWCLRPANDAAMLPRVLALAQEAAKTEYYVGQRPWYQQTLGMAEFRAGNDQAAKSAFLRAEQAAETGNWRPDLRPFVLGPSRFYRAIILFREGKKNEAKNLFHEAEAQMPPLPENAAQVLPSDVNQDKLVYWLAYREARAVLQIPDSANKL